ncbi:YcnI family protein [Ilumatobacter sp.]|uniref:YcnI family copper-binding membrane protein n=1 Tax=Ilumatobacter sp. TaxID=1967498 RepID=UPI003C31A81D
MSTSARVRRFGAAFVVAVGLAAVPATSASAHVSVSSTDAAPGGFGKVVFRVPSESETAKTVSISVSLPIDTPFAFVSTQAVPGWDVETTSETLPEPVEFGGFTVTEAVTAVTWTAVSDDSALGPHEFSEFAISAGPFPSDVGEMVFPATQTYSDDDVVEWADPVVEGEEEPERPAPVLALASTSETADASTTSADAAESTDAVQAAVVESGPSESDTLARILGGLGLVLGVVVLAWVGASRRSTVTST